VQLNIAGVCVSLKGIGIYFPRANTSIENKCDFRKSKMKIKKYFFVFLLNKKCILSANKIFHKMYISETTVRVRYAETDKMGYVYYGNYTQYYEVGRVEALRALGTSYKEMEDNGVMLPVYTCNLKYLKPALYDDLLIIKTTIKELPTLKITFDYEIYNQKNELLNTGNTTLVFINMSTNKPCRAPESFIDRIKQYF
jgi:acyl-CoA thioester hydrolase